MLLNIVLLDIVLLNIVPFKSWRVDSLTRSRQTEGRK